MRGPPAQNGSPAPDHNSSEPKFEEQLPRPGPRRSKDKVDNLILIADLNIDISRGDPSPTRYGNDGAATLAPSIQPGKGNRLHGF